VGWGEGGGVGAFTDYIRSHHLEQNALPSDAFYPIPMHEWTSLTDGSIRLDDERLRESHAVHLWNEFFRRNGYAKEAPYPSGSFLDDCVRQFL